MLLMPIMGYFILFFLGMFRTVSSVSNVSVNKMKLQTQAESVVSCTSYKVTFIFNNLGFEQSSKK